jgi:hypothetical protein
MHSSRTTIWNGELFSLDGRKKVARRYSERGRRCQEDASRESKRASGCNGRSPRGGGKEEASVVSLERVGARGDGRKQDGQFVSCSFQLRCVWRTSRQDCRPGVGVGGGAKRAVAGGCDTFSCRRNADGNSCWKAVAGSGARPAAL